MHSYDPTTADAVREVVTLLAAAYLRHSVIRRVPVENQPSSPAERLDNSGVQSVHECS